MIQPKNKTVTTLHSAAVPTIKKQQIIKADPYENPENVMELMAKICSAQSSADTEVYWDIVSDAYNKEINGVSLSTFLSENRNNLWNKDFEHDINDLCRRLSWSLTERQNTEDTQVVVAGGFSSGKSSFLNRITGCSGLLPTGVEPVSVVKTYLYCSNHTDKVTVKGVNQKNVLVDLNTGVLQAIQHANKSNIYLASVLDKLFVRIPSSNLDGLVFIDTPGYNNSDKANASNGKTDKETALEAMSEGNVMFWLIDCERGTTVSDDLDIIKQFEGKKVFIFNKADKKGESESKRIVEAAADIIYSQFPKEDIIDIIAYSTLDNKLYYSKNSMSLLDIIDEIKHSGNGIEELTSIKESIKDLFETEIHVSQNTINGTSESEGYQTSLKAAIDEKDKYYRYWQEDKNDNKDFLKSIKDIMVDNYSEVSQAAQKLNHFAEQAFSGWLTFHNGVLYFENNDHWGHSDILDRAINTSAKQYNSRSQQYASFNYESYNEEIRKNQYGVIVHELERLNSLYKNWYDDACEKCEKIKQDIELENALQRKLSAYEDLFISAIEMGINEYNRQNKATSFEEKIEDYNIFKSIESNNYKHFLHCFENGVDLANCNSNGYNPMTYAVEQGNNMMVSFMLEHNADPNILDKRGYNAFHTAVENQYKDMCKLLLDYDPDIIGTKTANGETVEDLANKHTFTEWIYTEIDNAI